MKVNWRKIFTLAVSDSEYFTDEADKIEYTGCKKIEKTCLSFLPAINEHFRESDRSYRDRDFDRSIEALEKAYYKAGEIQEQECMKCALFFQATAVQSLEGLHEELGKMSKGFFATRRYQPQFEKAGSLLNKIKTTKEVKPAYTLAKSTSMLQPVYL